MNRKVHEDCSALRQEVIRLQKERQVREAEERRKKDAELEDEQWRKMMRERLKGLVSRFENEDGVIVLD
jgi:hypothetical protein